MKYKLTSPSNFERILAYFYIFKGYNFKDKWELFEQIKGDLGNYESDLKIISKHSDRDILQTMANLSKKESFTLNNCAQEIGLNKGKQAGNTGDLKVELADKMAM